jgi:hypothetical protein
MQLPWLRDRPVLFGKPADRPSKPDGDKIIMFRGERWD